MTSRAPSPLLRLPLCRILLAVAVMLAVLAGVSGTAGAAVEYVPGEVIVKYKDGTDRGERAAVQRATSTSYEAPVAPQTSLLETDKPVGEAIDELRERDDVEYAVPNVKARAAYIPNDPGFGDGWQSAQWNFAGPAGVNAPDAWDNLIAAGRPGGQGVTVAVLDTGVAYRNWGPFRRSPDLDYRSFVRGYDFLQRNHRPLDRNGHGTHIASTIVQATNNGRGVTGLAYNARIMPLRVLNANGEGEAATIARAIRFAADRDVDVINLSLEFGSGMQGWQIPDVLAAIRYAVRRNVLVVAAAGNEGAPVVAYPARAPRVVSVGATTMGGCLAEYSNSGQSLDLVAPGGGADSSLGGSRACQSSPGPGEPIYQVTFLHPGDPRRFGLRVGISYEGTSMSAAHASATAALAIASGAVGPRPTPLELERHLKATARDIGEPGYDRLFGHGLVDAAAATRPR